MQARECVGQELGVNGRRLQQVTKAASEQAAEKSRERFLCSAMSHVEGTLFKTNTAVNLYVIEFLGNEYGEA